MSAKATPMPAEPKNTIQKRPIPFRTRSAVDRTVAPGCAASITVVAKTIETASLRMDSPKTNMFKTGSMSSAWKMARVATGSTAEMSEPKAKHSGKLKLYAKPAW